MNDSCNHNIKQSIKNNYYSSYDSIFTPDGFPDDELTFKSYDDVSWFIIQKLKHDLPFAKIEYYVNTRNLRTVTITCGDTTISIDLEIGYVEFCGIEYDFNLYDIVKLVKAIQHYIIKYTETDIDMSVYILNPWGW